MNRRVVVFGLGITIIAAASAGGWLILNKESPEYAWEQIHSLACDGDIDGFYSRVDWSSIEKATINCVSKENALATLVGEHAMEKVRQDWDDDIRLGKAGAWCQATRTDSDKGKRIVYWSTPSWKAKSGRFDRSGGKYILVDVTNEQHAARSAWNCVLEASLNADELEARALPSSMCALQAGQENRLGRHQHICFAEQVLCRCTCVDRVQPRLG